MSGEQVSVLHEPPREIAFPNFSNRRFGEYLGFAGDRAIVSGSFSDSAVYLFDLNSEQLLTELTPEQEAAFLSGTANNTDSLVIAGGSDAAYLFSAVDGTQLGRFEVPGTPLFGPVAIGNNRVIATQGQDAFLFDLATGGQIAELEFPSDDPIFSVTSTAISDGIVAVGDSGSNAVHIFDAVTGVHLRVLRSDDPAIGFGRRISVSGNLAVVGGIQDRVHLFDVETGRQLNTFRTPSLPDFNRFGGYVAIDGDLVLVGDPILTSNQNGRGLIFEAVARDGDFDGDGYIDADDIDYYVGNLDEPASFDERLDLDGDGTITLQDHQKLIETQVETPFGQGTLVGDINLDGTVNVLGDAFILISGLGTLEGGGYARGDLNADGRVNVLNDAFALIGNLGRSISSESNPNSNAVPEPGSLVLLTAFSVRIGLRRKRIA